MGIWISHRDRSLARHMISGKFGGPFLITTKGAKHEVTEISKGKRHHVAKVDLKEVVEEKDTVGLFFNTLSASEANTGNRAVGRGRNLNFAIVPSKMG